MLNILGFTDKEARGSGSYFLRSKRPQVRILPGVPASLLHRPAIPGCKPLPGKSLDTGMLSAATPERTEAGRGIPHQGKQSEALPGPPLAPGLIPTCSFNNSSPPDRFNGCDGGMRQSNGANVETLLGTWHRPARIVRAATALSMIEALRAPRIGPRVAGGAKHYNPAFARVCQRRFAARELPQTLKGPACLCRGTGGEHLPPRAFLPAGKTREKLQTLAKGGIGRKASGRFSDFRTEKQKREKSFSRLLPF